MGDDGLEPDSASPDFTKDLRKSPVSHGAKSGALSAQSALIDADLAMIIDRWHGLPQVVKAGILAMVRSAASSCRGGGRSDDMSQLAEHLGEARLHPLRDKGSFEDGQATEYRHRQPTDE